MPETPWGSTGERGAGPSKPSLTAGGLDWAPTCPGVTEKAHVGWVLLGHVPQPGLRARPLLGRLVELGPRLAREAMPAEGLESPDERVPAATPTPPWVPSPSTGGAQGCAEPTISDAVAHLSSRPPSQAVLAFARIQGRGAHFLSKPQPIWGQRACPSAGATTAPWPLSPAQTISAPRACLKHP